MLVNSSTFQAFNTLLASTYGIVTLYTLVIFVNLINRNKKGWKGRDVTRSASDYLPYQSELIVMLVGLQKVLEIIGLLSVWSVHFSRKLPWWLLSSLSLHGDYYQRYFFSPIISEKDLNFWIFLRSFGFVLFLFANYISYTSSKIIGSNWDIRPVIRQGHTLETKGPYSYIRHPVYASTMLLVLSGVFCFDSFALIIVRVLNSLLSTSRYKLEENLLTEEFGFDYKNYMANTGAFIPVSLSPYKLFRRE
jgi:protein-S-isoprenylcysteine O-methyltransferase Ste14